MKNSCVSLCCPFKPYCKEYNFLVDRGDECEIQKDIERMAQQSIKQKKKAQRKAGKKDGR